MRKSAHNCSTGFAGANLEDGDYKSEVESRK
jgi:hypothetical protein